MKQFDLEEFKKNPNRKVVTRDGLPVRVICTDKKGEYPVVALIRKSDNNEEADSFKENGLYIEGHEVNTDLFFDTYKEGWVNIYRIPDTEELEASCIFSTKEEAEFYRGDNPNYVTTTKINWEE